MDPAEAAGDGFMVAHGYLSDDEGVHDEDGDGWVPFACFLRAVGQQKSVHVSKRFLTNKKGMRWRRQDGGRPRINLEYKYKKGAHGGGAGGGVLHGRLAWLRFVYWKHYAKPQ